MHITLVSYNKYLDLYGGHAVISIGHGHDHYVKSLTEQLNEIGFYSNAIFELNDKPIMSLYEDSSKVDYLVA